MDRSVFVRVTLLFVLFASACRSEHDGDARDDAGPVQSGADAAARDASTRDAARPDASAPAHEDAGMPGTNDGGPDANEAAGNDGGAFHHMDLPGATYRSSRDPDCQDYRLRFADTCDGCASGSLDCACLDSPLVKYPISSCTLGHCIVDYDCAALCRHATDDWGSDDAVPFLEEIDTFVGCLDRQSCTSNANCGGGYCTGPDAMPVTQGWCVDGGDEAYCQVPDDCTSGVCISSMCQLGQARSGCASDLDCPGMRCLKMDGAMYGECSAGKLGEGCGTGSDCAKGLACFPSRQDDSLGKVAGRCTTEPAGKTCMDDDAECSGGHCVGGYCSTGHKGSACIVDAQCAFGVCTDFGLEALAYCSNGELGAWCKADTDCTKGRCTFQVTDGFFGFCSDGSKGSLCVRDGDCTGSCGAVPAGAIDVRCTRLGELCGVQREGICDADFHCQYRRCGT